MKHFRRRPTIGGLARAAGVNVETIRYYQRRGLLPQPARPAGRIRQYGDDDLARLTFIKTAQKLGFSLDEIADLLRLDDGTHCEEARAMAEQKLRDVSDKIERLRRIQSVLTQLVQACHKQSGTVACPLIASLHEGVLGSTL